MGLNLNDIAVISVVAILTSIGLILYVLTLVILFLIYQKSRQTFYVLMISLALPEIFWLVITLVYSVPSMVYGADLFGLFTERVMGNIDTIVYFMQLTHLFFISINRLRFVARSSTDTFDKVFTAHRVVIWSSVLWAFSIANGILLEATYCYKHMNHYYWSMSCAQNSTASATGTLINATLSNFFPFASALIYLAMWCIIKWKQKKITANAQQSWKKNVSLILQFSLVTACLIMESLAYWILPMVFDGVQMSAMAHIMAVICSSINPYIYLLFNNSVKDVLRGWFGMAKVEPTFVAATRTVKPKAVDQQPSTPL